MAGPVTEAAWGRRAPDHDQSGRAPRGMWWVAWRQHRVALMVCCAPWVVIAAVLVIGRVWYVSVVPSTPAACSPPSYDWVGCGRALEHAPPLGTIWTFGRLAVISLPVLTGAIAGGTLFFQERDRGTQLFALTQSVGRIRWYLTKCVVLLVPTVAAAVLAGVAGQWVTGVAGSGLWSALGTPDFQATGLVPAALLLLSFGLSVPVGVLLRSLPAVLTAALLTAATCVVVLGFLSYTDLVPHDRMVGSLSAEISVPVGALELGHDYVGVTGAPVVPQWCPDLTEALNNDDGHPAELTEKCYRRQGITQQALTYLAPARRPQLTLTLAGICTALAAAGLTLGLWLLRRRPI